MKLYLVQHGQSAAKEVDSTRGLTDEGRRDTRLMAEMAAKLELGLVEIRHSGKTRAEQTAAIFGETLQPERGVQAVAGLNPLDDVQLVADSLGAETERLSPEPLMLVGHLPFMSRLAALLVNGDPESEAAVFSNSGIVCLGRTFGPFAGRRWRFLWQLNPGA
jgi:phosphohistidine phosphatase